MGYPVPNSALTWANKSTVIAAAAPPQSRPPSWNCPPLSFLPPSLEVVGYLSSHSEARERGRARERKDSSGGDGASHFTIIDCRHN